MLDGETAPTPHRVVISAVLPRRIMEPRLQGKGAVLEKDSERDAPKTVCGETPQPRGQELAGEVPF